MEEEVVFFVKIDKKNESFSFSKRDLTEFEQANLELFLESYVKAERQRRINEMYETLTDYDGDDTKN